MATDKIDSKGEQDLFNVKLGDINFSDGNEGINSSDNNTHVLKKK